MSRQKGTLSLASNIEPSMNAPLDARVVVNLISDLTASGSFPYFYQGMLVACKEDHKIYQLTGGDPTVAANWVGIGSIDIDSSLSGSSENPVQNKVIKNALDGKADLVDGKVPASQLPSFVDDVVEAEDVAHFPATGESGKIYVALDTNKTYRWGGSDYVEISQSLALGETSSTAYRGDRGKEAYDISQTVGAVGDLTTTAKTTVVAAINEVNAKDGVPAGGTTGQVLTKKSSTDGDVEWVSPSSDAALSSAVTSNLAVGGIASGTTLAQGTTFTQFAQKLLITEIAPDISFTASGSGVKEVGTSVTPTLTLTITSPGTGTPTSIKFYSGSTLLDTQSYVSGTDTYTFTMEAISATTTVKGVLDYTKSDGTTTASIEKTATYTFVMASYYGAVATAPTDKAGITALTKNVKNTKAQTAIFTLSNQRSCYCYPASFGNLTSIKDANNFEYLSSYTKTTVEVDGVNYNVYTLTDPVTASGFKQIYA